MPIGHVRSRALPDAEGASQRLITSDEISILASAIKSGAETSLKTALNSATKSKLEPITPAGGAVIDQSPKTLKAVISQRYDKLNAVWKKAEDDLREYLVPFEVVHEYKRTPHPNEELSRQYGFDVAECLAWTKTRTGWHLCHGYLDESSNGGENVEYSYTPILDSSIDRRNECVIAFKDLKKKVIETAQQLVQKLDDNIASLTEAIK